MTALANAPLVQHRGRHVDLGAEPTAVLWRGELAAVTLGDGSVRWIGDAGEAVTTPVHQGAILTACRHPDGHSVVTGGDDGPQVARHHALHVGGPHLLDPRHVAADQVEPTRIALRFRQRAAPIAVVLKVAAARLHHRLLRADERSDLEA